MDQSGVSSSVFKAIVFFKLCLNRRCMMKRSGLKKLLFVLALVFVGAPSCGDDGEGCPAIHIVSVEAYSQGPTDTCGPETLPPDVTTSTSGTVVTVQYHVQLIVCGGRVEVELEQAGSRLTITERAVDLQGVCGCYNKYIMTVAVDVCEQGTYTLVVSGGEHEVTL